MSVRGVNLRAALRRVTVAWMFGVVWLSCISGSHVRVFARMLGFNDFAFGLMSALPFLANFGQIAASAAIERTHLVKRPFFQWALIHRAVWLLVAVIPLVLPIPSPAAVAAMLAVLGGSWFTQALSAPAWWTWMGRLIPRRIRGRYFANRARLSLMIQAVAVITVGVIMDKVYVRSLPDRAAAQPVVLRTACVIFVAAAVFGLADILLFGKVPEMRPRGPGERGPARRGPGPAALKEFFWEPLKDRQFRRYVLYAATQLFSLTVGGWYFWRNAQENLGFSNLATNVLFLVVGPAAGILAARGWGKAIDRWGRKPVLMLGTFGAMISTLPWLFFTQATPAGTATYAAACLACLVGGAMWMGIGLADTGVILGLADGDGQSRYVAAAAVFTSVGGALGGVVGGVVTQALKAWQQHPLRFGPVIWNNWHAAFAVVILARLGAMCWLAGMPEPKAARARDLVRMMQTGVFKAVRTGAFYSLRLFTRRRRS